MHLRVVNKQKKDGETHLFFNCDIDKTKQCIILTVCGKNKEVANAGK